jgi:ppGpp synthetase/RelA/SpoT-type nucleotidyltranferase
MLTPSEEERPIVEAILARFDERLMNVELFHTSLLNTISKSTRLAPLIHSIRARIKDRTHLQDKLLRKMRSVGDKPFDISPDNLHTKINDLAGLRLLHLHTAQAAEIHLHLSDALRASGYKFVEGPVARTWDIEYENIFKAMGFKTKRSETLYTSVHYVVSDQIPGLKMTCELQVRTLAEEIWGEVDHKLNYPHKMESVACSQQIKALARATSAAGRLVDSIFATVADEAGRAVTTTAENTNPIEPNQPPKAPT